MSDNAVFDMMFRDALIGLENGCLMPWDKQVLADSPLPENVITPYTSKEVPDVLTSMQMTYSALALWIEESKDTSYFSDRFVQLSKMIRNGVTTMGRGLVTLHGRGEDISKSPMSVQDLIMTASCQFRKSYLGVLQTVKSKPEISERLLRNQISWNDTLMRLFKTREKLAEPISVVVDQTPASALDSGFKIQDSEKHEEIKLPKNTASGNQNISDESIISDNEITNEEHGLIPAPEADAYKSLDVCCSDTKALSDASGYKAPGAYTAPRAFSSFEGSRHESKRSVPDAAPIHEDQLCVPDSQLMESSSCCGDDSLHSDAAADSHLCQLQDSETPAPISNDPPPDDEGLPGYLKIMKNVYARSEPSENGELSFTFDELCYLAADPDFNYFYPEAAKDMRNILSQCNSS